MESLARAVATFTHTRVFPLRLPETISSSGLNINSHNSKFSLSWGGGQRICVKIKGKSFKFFIAGYQKTWH